MVRQTGPTAAAVHLILAAGVAVVAVTGLMRFRSNTGAERIFWIIVDIVLLALSAFLVRVAIWAFRNKGRL